MNKERTFAIVGATVLLGSVKIATMVLNLFISCITHTP